MMGLLCLQMAAFVQVAEAGGKDSDGDGTPDVGKLHQCQIITVVLKFLQYI